MLAYNLAHPPCVTGRIRQKLPPVPTLHAKTWSAPANRNPLSKFRFTCAAAIGCCFRRQLCGCSPSASQAEADASLDTRRLPRTHLVRKVSPARRARSISRAKRPKTPRQPSRNNCPPLGGSNTPLRSRAGRQAWREDSVVQEGKPRRDRVHHRHAGPATADQCSIRSRKAGHRPRLSAGRDGDRI